MEKLKTEYLEILKTFLDQNKKIEQLKIQYLEKIRNLFENEEEENYYKPVRVSKFSSKILEYIEYEINRDREKHYQLKNIFMKLEYV